MPRMGCGGACGAGPAQFTPPCDDCARSQNLNRPATSRAPYFNPAMAAKRTTAGLYGRTTGDPPTAAELEAQRRADQAREDRIRAETAEREAAARREALIAQGLRDAGAGAFGAIEREQLSARQRAELDARLELARIQAQRDTEVARVQQQDETALAQRGISLPAQQLALLQEQQAAANANRSWWDQRSDVEKVGIVFILIAGVWYAIKTFGKGRR